MTTSNPMLMNSIKSIIVLILGVTLAFDSCDVVTTKKVIDEDPCKELRKELVFKNEIIENQSDSILLQKNIIMMLKEITNG